MLTLPDFFSALYTIDHSILVHHFHADIGFTDTALQWFSSYLTDHSQYVPSSNHCSVYAPVHSGVSHCSSHGPVLFSMYINIYVYIIYIYITCTSVRCNRQSEFTLLHFTIFQ